MKDLEFRLKLAHSVLLKLASTFDVDEPKLIIKNMQKQKLHGFYAFDTITLNTNTLHNNLAEALRTVRHEFWHYLEDTFNLAESKSESKARRFEKNIFSLEILPKSQTRLLEVKKQ